VAGSLSSPSKELFSARSKASRDGLAGISRRQVLHSGPAGGDSLPAIVHVPCSQQAILTRQWQPWRSARAAASGRTAAVATRARRRAAETSRRRRMCRVF